MHNFKNLPGVIPLDPTVTGGRGKRRERGKFFTGAMPLNLQGMGGKEWQWG
jgi:hypothetical protein